MRVPLVDLTAQFRPIKQEVMRAIEDVLDDMHLFLDRLFAEWQPPFLVHVPQEELGGPG